MSTQANYSFLIIRYVPDLVREEFINIGVLIWRQDHTEPPVVRFTQNWTRLSSLADDVDTDMLQALGEELSYSLADNSQAESSISLMKDLLSGSLQASSERGRAAESINALTEELMALYVHPSMRTALFALATGA